MKKKFIILLLIIFSASVYCYDKSALVFNINNITVVDGTSIEKVVIEKDPYLPDFTKVSFCFNNKGKKIISKETKNHLGENMRILFGGEEIYLGRIMMKIDSGSMASNFSPEQEKFIELLKETYVFIDYR